MKLYTQETWHEYRCGEANVGKMGIMRSWIMVVVLGRAEWKLLRHVCYFTAIHMESHLFWVVENEDEVRVLLVMIT